MQSVTYSSLIERAQFYVNNLSITSQEWNVHINDAAREYWNLINLNDQLYNLTSYSFTTVANQAEYDLPSDMLLFRDMDLDFSNNTTQNSINRINVSPMPIDYRNVFRVSYAQSLYNIGPYYYMIFSTTIVLQPIPQANITGIIWYVPYTPSLVNLSDTIDGINGFDVFISARAAKSILDSKGKPSASLDDKITQFITFMKDCTQLRNRGQRRPIIRREISPTTYIGSFGNGSSGG